MSKGRLEAFSDGVIAILITIMVLELSPPEGTTPAALAPLTPVFFSYVLSFIFLGIYWSNHHHLLQAIKHVDGRVLWANIHLLFWLSLVPFATAWMGDHPFMAWPVALYGMVLLFASIAYFILTRSLLALHGHDSILATAMGTNFKGKVSVIVYLTAIPVAFIAPLFSCLLYASIAVLWIIPDRRIERILQQ
ncbi:MAG: DUF1211 domain-containing protein [Chloroflexi bacterium]|nr:DUF1211 domain-containing protein [Chloroflexota bacterium]